MFINLDGATLEQVQDQEECKRFILSAFALKHENAKDIIETSEKPFNVWAYRYDAGMLGTSTIRFLVTTETEDEVLNTMYDELRDYVEGYSVHWHVNYEAETDEEDPYQDAFDQHLENAEAYVEPYDPKLHHGKIPGGSKSVQFELLY